ncbi:hypothetical protein [Jannaschia marina]|uniref:hypothetical protein n=1 Tax=Jannaschia marina TaxID=2741674 RepID=UPI0015CBACB6|nr:hypothetical protein [Jannaschia marina]
MTALDGLDRLEAPGLWRPGKDEQRRDVYVTVGDAELVIEDKTGTALSHWSLPALVRVNPGESTAIYAPAEGSDEHLEITEPEMIAALERVRAAVEMGRRRPGALRRLTLGLVLGFATGIAILWLPGALRTHAANVVPTAQRAEIGRAMLDEVAALTGPPCGNPLGNEALAQFRDRLFPTTPLRLVVLRDLPQPALTLPGGILALSDSVMVVQDDPDVAAGHALAAVAAARAASPLADFLDEMSFVNLVQMLTTGETPDRAVVAHVERLLLSEPDLPDPGVLRPLFDASRIAWSPYARATGQPEGDATPSEMPPAMDDTRWQALREICSA